MSSVDSLAERFYERLKTVLAPGLRNSHYQYLDQLSVMAREARAWLDLGCGHNVVPDWIVDPASARLRPLAGIDLDLGALRMNRHVRLRALASGEALPF